MENESLTLGSGSLYSALPIPAYNVLAKAKKYHAQRVLIALCSHMGRSNRCVWPSYNQIAKVSGVRNRSSISQAITTLVEYGFVTVYRWSEGKKQRVKYYLQLSCWNSAFMNEYARVHLTSSARCLACLMYLQRGDYFVSGDLIVHYGCGGFVMTIGRTAMPAVQEPWRDRVAELEKKSAEEYQWKMD